MAQFRERGRAVGVGDGWDRFTRLLDGLGVVAVVTVVGILNGVGMVRGLVTIVFPVLLVLVLSSVTGVRILLLRLVVLVLGMSGGGDGAQRDCKQGAGQGGGREAHSSTRTSRIIPASMW